jgi:hypothetical protein
MKKGAALITIAAVSNMLVDFGMKDYKNKTIEAAHHL